MITEHPGEEYWDTPADIRVNTVNCVGVMGKGIALEFKRRYPAMFTAYRGICRGKVLRPGEIHVYDYPDLKIINAATKDHWSNHSRYTWVYSCIARIDDLLGKLPRASHHITIPAMGCANGGLYWQDVRLRLKDRFKDSPHHVHIFSPI